MIKGVVIATATILLLGIGSNISVVQALNEDDRIKEYKARGYEWPLKHLVPDTPGWNEIFRRRFEQVEETIENDNDRYNAWMQVMSSALVQPNFTENGWGLTKAPQELIDELKKKLHDGMEDALPEANVDVIETGKKEEARPLFIENTELNFRVLNELKPMHEEWAGVDLVGEIAYGLRVYREDSRLLMHVDRSRTHIISSIIHVDHSEDSEPWPIVIEDFQGNTNEVVLESGDMLFYESSKCLHGRPKKFKGSWYSSLFVHYYPVGWDTQKQTHEIHYAVPRHWKKEPEWETSEYKLAMVGTSMKEPECEDVWCRLEDSVKWFGPAKEGEIISTGSFNPHAEIKADEEEEWEYYDDDEEEETQDEL